MADSPIHFYLTEVEYAKKEAAKFSPWPVNAGDTAYVHIPSGVRAVRITAVEKQPDGTLLIKFENLTSP